MAANRSLLADDDFSSIGAKKGEKKSSGGGSANSTNAIKIGIVAAVLVLAAGIYAWQFGLLDFGGGKRAKQSAAMQPTAEQKEQIDKQEKYNEAMLKSGQASEAGS